MVGLSGSGAIFAGIGAAQGAGVALQHNTNLTDALDAKYQEIWEQNDADKSLSDAQEANKEKFAASERAATLDNDPIAKAYQSQPTTPAAPPQQAPGAQAVPGTPAGMQGSIQPRTAPISAGQPTAQGDGTQPPQGQTQPAPTQQAAPVQGQGQIQSSPLHPTSVNAGGDANQAPNAPPPAALTPPTAPANLTAGTFDAAHAAQTQDPYDIAAHVVAKMPNGGWDANTHDTYMNAHAANPSVPADELAGLMRQRQNGEITPDEFNKQVQTKEAQYAKLKNVDQTQLAPDDKATMGAYKNLGIQPANLREPSPSEQKGIDNLVSKAQDTRVAAVQGINTLNSVLGIKTDLANGPMSTSVATVRAAFDKMTDQQASDAVRDVYVLNKDNIQLTNSAMKSLGNVRPGIGLANLEKAGNPSSDMPIEARKEVALQLYAQYRATINHADAVSSGPSELPVADRIKFATKHDDANPAILGDGQTLNPNFVDFGTFRDSVANGTFKPGATANDVRGNQGGQSTAPTQGKPDQFMQQIQTNLPQGWTIKKN